MRRAVLVLGGTVAGLAALFSFKTHVAGIAVASTSPADPGHERTADDHARGDLLGHPNPVHGADEEGRDEEGRADDGAHHEGAGDDRSAQHYANQGGAEQDAVEFAHADAVEEHRPGGPVG